MSSLKALSYNLMNWKVGEDWGWDLTITLKNKESISYYFSTYTEARTWIDDNVELVDNDLS